MTGVQTCALPICARVATGELEEASKLFERAQYRLPLPDTAAALGDLYQKLGRADAAKRQHELVEFIDQNSAASGTYSRQLAMFWADHDEKLDQALAIAQKERSTRQDIYTCDALAWILYKNDRLEEAKKSIAEALRLGTRDARLYYHAGMIYNELGDRQSAVRYLTLALQTNPTFDVLQAELAKKSLGALKYGHEAPQCSKRGDLNAMRKLLEAHRYLVNARSETEDVTPASPAHLVA